MNQSQSMAAMLGLLSRRGRLSRPQERGYLSTLDYGYARKAPEPAKRTPAIEVLTFGSRRLDPEEFEA